MAWELGDGGFFRYRSGSGGSIGSGRTRGGGASAPLMDGSSPSSFGRPSEYSRRGLGSPCSVGSVTDPGSDASLHEVVADGTTFFGFFRSVAGPGRAVGFFWAPLGSALGKSHLFRQRSQGNLRGAGWV